MSKQSLAFKEKGNALFGQKKYMEAVEQYTFAIECSPQEHTFYTNRAACYATMGEWEKCLRDANRAIDRKNDWVKGWFRKGQACMELHKYKEAYEAFKMAYSYEEKPDFKKRMDAAEKEWKKDMSAAALAKEKGNAHFKVGQIAEALKAYEDGINKLTDADDQALKVALYNNVAHCQVQLYEPKKVISACTTVIDIEPFNAKALLRRAVAYESIEKTRAAMNDFQQVLLVDPGNALANKGAARCRNALKAQGKEI
eukprot:TRINITY_DN92_c0_g1_i1.p2 TRINITY_DN92_c0_g1~~TRINITY_DN92_c0_g1_i1.p2  ORF type:complete len:255 (+),score=142.63 TRINITY_DN92_c0_g1_i1:129-893(+)